MLMGTFHHRRRSIQVLAMAFRRLCKAFKAALCCARTPSRVAFLPAAYSADTKAYFDYQPRRRIVGEPDKAAPGDTLWRRHYLIISNFPLHAHQLKPNRKTRLLMRLLMHFAI